MKVFICWSGARSQAVAQSLRDWMPLVLHFVQPWLSDVDIAAGERWAQSVAKERFLTRICARFEALEVWLSSGIEPR